MRTVSASGIRNQGTSIAVGVMPGAVPRIALPGRPRISAHEKGRYSRAMSKAGDYPEKTCSIDRLVRHKRLLAAALRGDKTEPRRNGI